jgi:hypothetical protein
LPSRLPDHLDEIDGPARRVIVEHANDEAAGGPGEGIEIGAVRLQHRAIGELVMTMDHVEVAMPASRRSARPCRSAMAKVSDIGISQDV